MLAYAVNKSRITTINAVIDMWIHEHQSWPDFIWDEGKLASMLSEVRHRQGRLLGRMEGLGFVLRREASLITLTNDVVKSSAIEGENLDPREVNLSIVRRLDIDFAGLVPTSRDVEAIDRLKKYLWR